MFRINYTLKKPGMIVSWGEEAKHLHWYGLTDGLLWISAGDSIISVTFDSLERGKMLIFELMEETK
ncbi:MAG: hypothetical protein J6U23_11440 [Clostridiales bacterium]|nr:hypothetical protein [Clostridiales bacterium]